MLHLVGSRGPFAQRAVRAVRFPEMTGYRCLAVVSEEKIVARMRHFQAALSAMYVSRRRGASLCRQVRLGNSFPNSCHVKVEKVWSNPGVEQPEMMVNKDSRPEV